MIQLIDDQLGVLELRGQPYTVASFEISARATRAVVTNRALADGHVDDTRYAGGRAATIAIVFNERRCNPAETMQSLLDRLAPYTVARRRPIMRWSLPGSGDFRQMVVRGEGVPVQVSRPRHLALVVQFTSDGEIISPEQEAVLIEPALDVETGRAYDRTYDSTYPASIAVGDRIVTQGGNEPAHWVGTIFGNVTGPYFKINGTTVEFAADYNLPDGSAILINTRERTMYLNGDPSDSVGHLTNFDEWSWDQLMLIDGENQVRYGAEVTGAAMQIVFHKTWAA